MEGPTTTPSLSRRNLLTSAAYLAAGFVVPSKALLDLTQNKFKPQPSPIAELDHGTFNFQRIRPNIGVLSGAGGNVTVLSGKDGLIVVDAGVPVRGKDLVTFLARQGKVKQLINTHFHFDHTGGNWAFGESRVPILAHEKTRTRLQTPQPIDSIGFVASPQPAWGLPTQTFNESFTLYGNGEEIHLHKVPTAHSDTDVFVHFQNSNVLSTGDLLFNGAYPIIDYNSGGHLVGTIEALEILLKHIDASTTIVSGHGAVGTRADIEKSRDMLAGINDTLQSMIKAGKSVQEIVAAKPTQAFDATFGGGLVKPDFFVTMAVTSILRHNSLG